MIEGIPIWLVASIVGTLGSPGVILLFWYLDHRKMDRIRREDMRLLHEMREHHQAEVAKQRSLDREALDAVLKANREALDATLKAYQEDVRTVAAFYERNVELVKSYEKMADGLADIIHLSTQTMTNLVSEIRHNTFCPVLREKGPGG